MSRSLRTSENPELELELLELLMEEEDDELYPLLDPLDENSSSSLDSDKSDSSAGAVSDSGFLLAGKLSVGFAGSLTGVETGLGSGLW